MSDPIFDDDSVSLVFKGEVTPEKEYQIPFEEQRKTPYIVDPAGKDIQLYISDYFLNTTLYSLHQNKLLDLDLRTMNGSETGEPIRAEMLSILFPTLKKNIDPQSQISIRIKTTEDYVPNFNIQNGESIAQMKLEISFASLDPSGKRMPFIEIISNTTVEVDFEITNPFNLVTDFKQMKIKAQSIQLDKFNLTNLEDLNSIIGTASGFIRNLINTQFSGYKFGEIDMGFIQIDVNKTTMYEKDRYIYADMAPHFSNSIKQAATEKYVIPDSKPVTYKQKVDALASVLKLTPLFDNIRKMQENSSIYSGISNIGTFGVGFASKDTDNDSQLPMEREDAQKVYQ
jgi:hypothetical protein